MLITVVLEMGNKIIVHLLHGQKRQGCPVRPADRGFTGDPTSLAVV